MAPKRRALAAVLAATLVPSALAADGHDQAPPKTWVDKDTGHRVIRFTDEPGSSGFYFNINAYSPDGNLMVYNSRDGIHILDLATRKTRLLVPNPPPPADAAPGTPGFFRNGVRTVVVGHKTNSVFFTKSDPDTHQSTVYK